MGTIGIIVGGFLFIGLLGQMRPKVEKTEPEIVAPTVFFQIAENQSVTLDVRTQGEVRPRTDITLTAEVAGRVERVSDRFVDGGAFEEGDILLEIEDADHVATAAAAKARVAQAEEGLRREEAEAALAERDYQDLGRADAPTDLALRIPQLAQARANFEAAKAEYRSAQINLNRTKIRAPFDGRVRTRDAGIGQFISPGAQLGRIFSTDVAEIRLPLTDENLAQLGLPIAFIETDDNQGPNVALSAVVAGRVYNWTGRIARTDGAIDPTTRQVIAIAVVDDPYGAAAKDGAPLAIGLFVDAVIEGKPFGDAIVLPRSALHGRNEIYVVDAEDILSIRQVNVVATDRDTITVAGGISAGDKVVTSPLRGARDGDLVSPEPENDVALNTNLQQASLTLDVIEEESTAGKLNSKLDPATTHTIDAAEELARESSFPNAQAIPTQIEPASIKVTENTDVSERITIAQPSIAEGATQQYRPGEPAPTDEMADTLNANQLSRNKQNNAAGDQQ